ncbi:MAG: hypothetical protein K6E84_05660 [Lachnospiraceae bacterium]|nr:hypothetical protein [Lachnospiraceae bacterium]
MKKVFSKLKAFDFMGRTSLNVKTAFLSSMILIIGLIVVLIANKSAYTKRISDMVSEDMRAIAISYGQTVETAIRVKGGQQLTVKNFEESVGQAVIPNDEAGYIYVVDQNGTMLYHPTPEKIGQPVENDAVKHLVSELEAGRVPEPGMIEYVFKGEKKYAGYYITQEGLLRDIVVVSANLANIKKQASRLPVSVLVSALICAILGGAIAYFAVGLILKPINHLGVSLKRVANLDFTEDTYLTKFENWQNETGMLARSTLEMSRQIDRITLDIKSSVDRITAGSEQINTAVNAISAASTDNANTVVDLASMMEETTATTDTIASNMDNMVKKSEQVSELAQAGIEVAGEIYERAADGIKQAERSKKKAGTVLAEIRVNTEKALNDAKAINRINELTETIKGITEQTNLLSLNASIEAARAGVAGRGFAVVADEIGKLANESAATVGQIDEIITEIRGAVEGMRDCLSEVLDFTEKSTEENLGLIEQISNQYNTDTAHFEKSLSEMQEAMGELEAIITEVDESIDGINTTIAQSGHGISDVAGKTDDVVEKTNVVEGLAHENVNQTENLQNLIGEFTL